MGTLTLIMRNKSMMLFGLVNSLFEGAMYSFVFMWVTMFGVLSGAPLPTGLVLPASRRVSPSAVCFSPRC